MKSIQYTIRNIPEPVDKALKQIAKENDTSFNQTVIDTLSRATGATSTTANGSLDWFIGSECTDDQGFLDAQKWLDSLPKEIQ